MADVDVAIVGAGAAGIAASRRLAAAGARLVLVEARERVGGRAHTLHVEGLPLDLGCGWLHDAAENRCREVFQHELGLELDRTPPPWGGPALTAGFPLDAQNDYRRALGAFEARLEAAAHHAHDRPASDLLEPGARWNPLLEAFSNAYNGAELERISVKDFARYREGNGDWRAPGGYGAAVAQAAERLPIRLGAAVTRISDAADEVRIALADGAALTAEQVIVTLPPSLLARGAVAFDPPLPTLAHAASVVPLGCAGKAFHAIEGAADDLAPPESLLYGATDTARTASHHIRPFGRPYVESYFGGATARELEAAGEAVMLDFAREQIAERLGARWRTRLRPLAATRWSVDPLTRGAYSHALPGHAGARDALAASFGRRHFAGEAASPHFFSTAHGAWETGERAAATALAALKGSGR